MTYCIEVWGCASQTQPNCLFLFQKKIRIMSFSHYLAHTNPFFPSMEVLPLKVLESYFSIFLMENSILYAKIAVSEILFFFNNSVLNIIKAIYFHSCNNVSNTQ